MHQCRHAYTEQNESDPAKSPGTRDEVSGKRIVEAEEFRLVGPDGTLKAHLYTVENGRRTIVSVMRGSSRVEQQSLSLIADESEGVFLQLLDSTRFPNGILMRVGLVAEHLGETPRPTIELGENVDYSEGCLRLSVDPETKAPSFEVHDNDGTRRVGLQVEQNGEPSLTFYDRSGDKTRFQLTSAGITGETTKPRTRKASR